MRVEFHDGLDGELTGAAGRTVYRVVQEGLTNALRHGSGGEVTVSVRHGPAGLDICVENPAGPRGTSGSGLGLLGIAERVAVFGGSLRHGPTADGRYALAVTLPIRDGWS